MTLPGARRRDTWGTVWRGLGSNRLLTAWIGLIGLALLIAFWFPQAPRSAYLETGGPETWLASVRPRLGRPAETLFSLGFLTVARATWLRVVLAGTALSLSIRLFDAIHHLRRPDAGLRPVVQRELTLDAEPAVLLARATSWRAPGFRWWKPEMDQRSIVQAIAHRPLASIGTSLLAVGGLVMMAGWLWTQASGWEVTRLRLTEDTPAAIPVNEFVLYVESLQVEWVRDQTSPALASGRLVLWAEEPLASGQVDLDTGWRWRGITFRLTAAGPAVQVRGESANGSPLSLQTAADSPPAEQITLLLSDEIGPRSFAVPNQGLVVQLAPETADGLPLVHLRAYQGRAGELVEDQTIDREASFVLDDLRFSLNLIPFIEVTARYSPGEPVLVAGVLIGVAGLLLSWRFRPSQVEVLAAGSEGIAHVVLGATGREGEVILDAIVDHLVEEQKDETGDGTSD